jgi:hypothetical protein
VFAFGGIVGAHRSHVVHVLDDGGEVHTDIMIEGCDTVVELVYCISA